MTVRASTRTVKQWSVALLGVGLLCGSIVTAVAAARGLFLETGAVVVLVGTSVGVTAYGVWLLYRGATPDWTFSIARWVGGTVVGSTLLGALTILLLADGVSVGLLAGMVAYFGTIGGGIGVLLGYNDARRREQASEARSVRAAIEESTDAIAIVGPDGTFSLVNDAFLELHRFDSRDEVLGEDWRIRYPDDDAEHVETEIAPELEETGTWRGETTGVRADGEQFTQELSLSALDDGQVVAIVRDVSERKRRDREVEQLALEGTGMGIWEWQFATDEVVWNESLEQLVGLDAGSFGGTFDDFAEFVHPDDVSAMQSAVEEALDGGEMYQTEFRMERTDGTVMWAEARGRLIGSGDDRRMVGILADVTDRKQRVSALEETSSRLHLALGGASPAIWEWNVDTDELVWNESMHGILGYDPGEFSGDFTEFVEMIHPDDHATVFEGVAEARNADSVTSVDVRVADKSGEYRWIDLRGKIVEDDGATKMIGLARDVTDRETYRHELERRREMIERLHEATRTVIDAADVDAVCEAAAAAAGELLDAPLVGIWLVDDAGERLLPAAASDAAIEEFGEPPTYTSDSQSKSWEAFASGEVFVLENPDASDGALNPDTTVEHEIVLPIGDIGVMNVGTTGDRPFDEVDVYGARVLASNLVAVIDRARREEELRRQTDQLEFFSSILRHDVLNGMTVIRSRAEILAEQTTGQQQEYAETIVKWCGNVTDVTGRVQRVIEALTAPEASTSLSTTDVTALIDEQLDRLRTTHTHATFERDLPETASVEADELLSDVLGNLLTNAIEHNEGEITVRTSVEVGEEFVTIEIADDGSGVPDDRKETIFRRGETGHAKETGSGFGLFFVDAMVGRYGGEVSVVDNEAGGATFVVELSRDIQMATGDSTVADPAHSPESSSDGP
ncbi:PAS domain-containing sensor histidine kinase [Salinarchaeum laminariae]|uniref:PAS domain-containing sensor histidine kinase n=1 Tax=Salinarchaeum laminariae TaxID=869888 RepID=UPI0020BE56E2|nr:GAF domain-containing sensor histidine kinase [Salinarchaeum laminariae]